MQGSEDSRDLVSGSSAGGTHVSEQHTGPLEDVGHADPWCTYTPAQRIAVSCGPPDRRRAFVCCPCWLQTRVLWPASALAAEGLAVTLAERKLGELGPLLGAKHVSVSLAPRACGQPSLSEDSDADEVYIHSNEGRIDDAVDRAGIHRSELPCVSPRKHASVSEGNGYASLSSEAGGERTQRGFEGGSPSDSRTEGRERHTAGRGADEGEKRERSETGSWASLPLFRLQRLNLYTTTQRMLSLEERQALLDALRKALSERQKAPGRAGAPRTISTLEGAERGGETGQTSQATSGEAARARGQQPGEEARDREGSQAHTQAPKGEEGQDAATLAFVMLASPSAVWSWVANGLPLEESHLHAPVFPSYTAIHAGAKQIITAPGRKKSSGRSSASASPPASPFSSSPPAPQGSHASAERTTQPRADISHVLSTEADFMRLLEECKSSLIEGREAEKRRKREAQKLVALAIGPTTAAAARHAGFAKVVAASQPGLVNWTETLFQVIENHIEKEKENRTRDEGCNAQEGEGDVDAASREAEGGEEEDGGACRFKTTKPAKVHVLVLLTREEGKNMELVNFLRNKGVPVDFSTLNNALQADTEAAKNQADEKQTSSLLAPSSSPSSVPSTSPSSSPNASAASALRGCAGGGEERTVVAGGSKGGSSIASREWETGGVGTETGGMGTEKGSVIGETGHGRGGGDLHNIVMKVVEVPLLRTEASRGVFKRDQAILEDLLASNVMASLEARATHRTDQSPQ
ncbi:conserved hypothetical protein [Neospora caninum Liverpool]|nr:conserved hypothetical protein [Neospora caninum Liverpool]CBZ52599.1 conserved hypothetical protein [Neospora caninum Liverpool]|eukprot:XP_003882631.1 conserved hypothetical protein [Neospora caninum Liverpool]